MKEIELNIITPEKRFFSGKIIKLTTEDREGRLGILPNHMSVVKILEPSMTRFTTVDGKEFEAFTSEGILKVDKNLVEILCNSAEWPEDIDINRAKAAEERAEKRLKEKTSNLDVKRAELALKRALTRSKIKSI